MTDPRNLVLLGFMGTGKSAVGRILAKRLHRRFVDLDRWVETRAGCTIAEIFASEGETAFRRLEREAVRDVCTPTGRVVATGGGVVLDPLNLMDLAAGSRLVCLTATPETILRRIRRHPTRPLLQTPDPLGRIQALLQARAPLYAQIPLQVATDGLRPDAVATQILERLDLEETAPTPARCAVPVRNAPEGA